MLNHMVLVVAALAISTAVAAAKDVPKQEECSIFGAEEIENSIRQAPSCRRAVALFELCEFGASGDVGLGAAVTERCEGDFLSKLNTAQKRSYDREQKRCARKYRNEDGTIYRSFEAFCGAYVARDYSARFLKAAPAERK
ncbi:MAG: hypothetical protein WA813_13425 [Beijerinckiaceae bacterium]|jgi:hypothetical protein